MPSEEIVKGYPVDRDTYVEVTKEELENIALESTRTIDINEFVAKEEIDPRYIIRPYYLVPDGKVGHDAFAVIRETIRNMDVVAIGRGPQPRTHHRTGALDKGLYRAQRKSAGRIKSPRSLFLCPTDGPKKHSVQPQGSLDLAGDARLSLALT